MLQRLDKLIASTGLVTRSGAKDALKMGRVSVNGAAVKDGAMKVDPDKCTVALDGMPISSGIVVLMLNKPAGYVTSVQDPRDKTVMELVPEQYRRRVTPVGRLDKDTEGLLLLTDDGDLTHRLITPKKEVQKVYFAKHEGAASEEDVKAFEAGIVLKDGTLCLPAKLEPMGPGESRITVCEGKYHQVKRMMASRGMPVVYLERLQEGTLTLGDLPRGSCRLLTRDEISALRAE